RLNAIMESGAGTFTWDISFPAGLEIAKMEIISLTGSFAKTEDFNTASTSSTGSVDLDSGQYRIVFTLKKPGNDKKSVTWRETLHIYQNMESKFDYAFTDEHFIKKSYNVTLEYNDGILPVVTTRFHGVTDYADITNRITNRKGYVFKGWYTDAGLSTPLGDPTPALEDNISLYAKWNSAGSGNVTIVPGNERVVIHLLGIGSVTIDWGDGNTDTEPFINPIPANLTEIAVPGVPLDFTHDYTGTGDKTITISGDNIVGLYIHGDDPEIIFPHTMNFPTFDVSTLSDLRVLGLESIGLEELDVSNNTELEILSCAGNLLQSLDVSNNPALEQLYCQVNALTELDVSNNPALELLYCFYNQLAELDVSNNPALRSLECEYNELTSLIVNTNTALEELHCNDNDLTSLDVSSCTALRELYCQVNALTELDVSNNTALELLDCRENQLAELDVSSCTALRELYCYNNQLTELIVNTNTALEELHCYNNQLTELDVSSCTALRRLECQVNALTELDVSNNTALYFVNCTYNKLIATELQNICSNLPTGSGDAWMGNNPKDSPIPYDTTPGSAWDIIVGMATFGWHVYY
ncbi:MAG: InlB B-repeat-containing protein, partial [Leptospirales bacterium]|nr:InlB B-repeat-containing protein [Leptospirales bacterium]